MWRCILNNLTEHLQVMETSCVFNPLVLHGKHRSRTDWDTQVCSRQRQELIQSKMIERDIM